MGIFVLKGSSAIPNSLGVELAPFLALTATFKDPCFCSALGGPRLLFLGLCVLLKQAWQTVLSHTSMGSFVWKWAGTPLPNTSTSIKNRSIYVVFSSLEKATQYPCNILSFALFPSYSSHQGSYPLQQSHSIEPVLAKVREQTLVHEESRQVMYMMNAVWVRKHVALQTG